MADFKIGVLVPLRPNTDIMYEFKKIKDLELECCQISVWDMNLYTDETAEKIKEAAAETGVEVSALWAGWSGPKEWNFTAGPATLGIVPPAWRGIRCFDLLKGSEFAAKIGVKYVVTHAGFLPENPDDPNYNGVITALRYLCMEMKRRDQVFLFETGQETPVTLLRTIQDVGTGNLGINLDTANLILYGKANPVDALDVFGQYVYNTHCKDGLYPVDGRELGREVALGEGRANIQEVIRKLAALNYNGPLIIEREISGEKQTQDIINGRDLMRAVIKEL